MANTRTEVTDRLSGIAAVVPQAPSTFTEHDQSNFPVASGEHYFTFGRVCVCVCVLENDCFVPFTELELDDCGLRFVMLMQLYSYLCGTIPLVKRSQMMVSYGPFLLETEVFLRISLAFILLVVETITGNSLGTTRKVVMVLIASDELNCF